MFSNLPELSFGLCRSKPALKYTKSTVRLKGCYSKHANGMNL